MKRNAILAALLLSGAALYAQNPVSSPAITMVEGMINVDMVLDLTTLNPRSNEMVIVTPMLVNGSDTLALDPVAVAGRNRYIQYQRNNLNGLEVPAVVYKKNDAPAALVYTRQLPYSDWMDGATLSVETERYGCAACLKEPVETLDGLSVWQSPRLNAAGCFVYVQPEATAVKERSLSGRANVEFPVNKTTLLDDFRNNAAELALIRASVDSVRNDADVTVTDMVITGYASPEGSYANNDRLAHGRTEAVRDYVNRLYAFPAGLIRTAWTPEDWAGLRQWVAASNIDNREALLAVIDNPGLEPDARDRALKQQFPDEYAFLLENIYPTLRHTDYRIEYNVRHYSTPEEIFAVMKTRPGNLSLDELFMAAKTLTPGTPEFNEVFELAVRLYPDDPVANLNAANAAMQRNDLKGAERYLAKSGDSPEAWHARGVLAMLRADYDTAEAALTRSLAAGIGKSRMMLDQISDLREYQQLRSNAAANLQ